MTDDGRAPRPGEGMTGDTLRLLLVRHGESEANRAGRLQGRLDSPLTQKGRRQAEAIAWRVAAAGPIAALYASPLRRARATAEAIGDRVGIAPELVPDLMEVDIGEAMGLAWDEVRARWPTFAAALRGGEPDARWPGGESRRELGERAARVMDGIIARHPEGGAVVVVAHGGTLRWGVAHLMRGTPEGRPDHRYDNCAVTEVQLGGETPVLACLNDAAHLAEVEEEEAHADRGDAV